MYCGILFCLAASKCQTENIKQTKLEKSAK